MHFYKLRNELNITIIEQNMNKILQIFSMSIFDKNPLESLFQP
jgi:hypothetical protein